ncbi:MAG: hypothetical protein V7731_01810 [Amphritea sp.]
MIQTIREQIISGFADSLINLASSAVERCAGFRDQEELPAVTVWDLDEDASKDQYSRVNCSLPLVVVYADKLTGDPSKAANDMLGALIQDALASETTLEPLIDSIEYSGSTVDFPDGRDLVIVRAIFAVRYHWKGDPFTQ